MLNYVSMENGGEMTLLGEAVILDHLQGVV